MADSENKPSLPPLPPSPAPSPGEGEVVISIPEPDTPVEFIRRRFKEQEGTKNDNNDNNKEAIARVPHRLRRGKDDNSFVPNIISIGPYHRGRPKLQAMEKRKFQNISGIMNSPGRLEQLIEELKLLEDRVRRCYTNKYKPMSSNEFVEMMLLDSYFIIRVLENAAYPPDLTYDLLLLENQLPFFLIQSVFNIIPGKPSSYLISLTYRFYRMVSFARRHVYIPDEDEVRPTHLLQLYHRSIISQQIKLSHEKPKSKRINFNCFPFFGRNVLGQKRGRSYDQTPSKKSEEKEEEAVVMIPNATVLHEAGIKFKKNKGGGILDVKFNGGVLEIPPLFIDDGNVSLFNNLVALEDSFAYDSDFQHKPQFTAYFKFMDHIINTVSDVALLQRNGIIEHTFGSEKEVAQLFNQLTRGATINPNNYLSDLYKEVNKYHKTKRHIWGTMFLRRHCSNPLTILSTIGFLFLLALTVFSPTSQSMLITDLPLNLPLGLTIDKD